MSDLNEIVLLTGDRDTERTLKSLIESSDRFGSVEVCGDMRSLGGRLECGSIPIVLVDIDSNPAQMIEELEPIVNRYLHSRFIVLAKELQNDVIMQAMQAGIRHIQLKEQVSDELMGVLHRLVSIAPARQTGSAITVLSAGGGAGCTTLVVNLANELQLTTSKPVLIVDLDYAYGAVATYLELEGIYGIADVLNHDKGIDAELIQTTSVRHSDSIRVLLSPVSAPLPETQVLRPDRLGEMLAACKDGHHFTLFDAPRVPIDVATSLARASEVTLIVFQPVVKDIRVTRGLLTALVEKGIPQERIKPIMNRYRKRHEMIGIEEATKALGGVVPECLSNDYASASRGINYGKLLSSTAPRSALRRDMVQLASQFSGLETLKNTNGNHSRGLLG